MPQRQMRPLRRLTVWRSSAKASGTLVAQMRSGSSHSRPSQLNCTTSVPGSAEMTTPDAFAAWAALHARAGQHWSGLLDAIGKLRQRQSLPLMKIAFLSGLPAGACSASVRCPFPRLLPLMTALLLHRLATWKGGGETAGQAAPPDDVWVGAAACAVGSNLDHKRHLHVQFGFSSGTENGSVS